MRIFLAGSKAIAELTDSVMDALDSFLSDKAQILIGDCWGFDDAAQRYLASKGYQNVRVYCSGETPRRNHGNWPVEALLIKRTALHPGYSYWSQKDVKMVEDADVGFIVWDGSSRGSFIDAILLLTQEKELFLFMQEQSSTSETPDKSFRLSSLEHLRELIAVPKSGQEPKKREMAINGAIRASVPSLAIAEHLCSIGCSVSDATEIVVHAPIPLKLKILQLEQLAEYEDPYLEMVSEALRIIENSHDDIFNTHIPHVLNYIFRSSASNMLRQSKKALAALKLEEGEYMQAIEVWYDDELLDAKEHSGELFWIADAAFDWLRKLMAEEEWGSPEDELLCWTVFKKWSKGPNGYMRNPYNYYLIKDEVVYFDKNIFNESWTRDFDDVGLLYEDLHIYLPFDAGTIISIDCLPFAPTRRAVLIEKNPHGDPACTTAVYYDPHSKLWSVSSMTGSSFWEHGIPRHPGYSVLYNIEEYRGELQEEEKMLLKVSDFIREHPELGNKLYLSDAWYHDSRMGLTEDELLNLMNELASNSDAR